MMSLKKELDYNRVKVACEKIAQNINEENIEQIVTELEKI